MKYEKGIAFMQKVTEQNSTLGCTATAKSFYFFILAFDINYPRYYTTISSSYLAARKGSIICRRVTPPIDRIFLLVYSNCIKNIDFFFL